MSYSEAKYKYVGLTKKIRDYFPEKDKIFKLRFKRKIYEMKVNNKDCIMLTQIYPVYQFKEGDEIKITDVKEDLFELTVNS